MRMFDTLRADASFLKEQGCQRCIFIFMHQACIFSIALIKPWLILRGYLFFQDVILINLIIEQMICDSDPGMCFQNLDCCKGLCYFEIFIIKPSHTNCICLILVGLRTAPVNWWCFTWDQAYNHINQSTALVNWWCFTWDQAYNHINQCTIVWVLSDCIVLGLC